MRPHNDRMPSDARAEHRRRSRRHQFGGRRESDKRPATRPRLLLVEPHEDTRTFYALLFEEAGYAVHPVADGASALRVAEQRLPDVVILEVMYPWWMALAFFTPFGRVLRPATSQRLSSRVYCTLTCPTGRGKPGRPWC